jgi:hypothetical protein
MSQSEMPPGASAPPFWIELPQSIVNLATIQNRSLYHARAILQHSWAYSTPERVKPAAPQADVQSATVIAEAPPVTPIPVVRARPVVPSLDSMSAE